MYDTFQFKFGRHVMVKISVFNASTYGVHDIEQAYQCM